MPKSEEHNLKLKKINGEQLDVLFVDEAGEVNEEAWEALSRKRIVAYWWFVGWWDISLGIHISLECPNIEIHLPFGFFRVGWEIKYIAGDKITAGVDASNSKHGHGIGGKQ